MSSAPNLGDIVHLRTRHYVVEGGLPGPHGTVVDLACMDDDSQGSRLSAVETDLQTEPARSAEFYDAKTTRIEPVGIVYLWPA